MIWYKAPRETYPVCRCGHDGELIMWEGEFIEKSEHLRHVEYVSVFCEACADKIISTMYKNEVMMAGVYLGSPDHVILGVLDSRGVRR